MVKCDKPAKHWLGVQPGTGNPSASGPVTYAISGTLSGATGVTVTLSGDADDSVETDGAYEFTDLEAGSYTVTPTKVGYDFAPTSTNVTVTDADQTDKDFTGSVSGVVVTIWNAEDLSTGSPPSNITAAFGRDHAVQVFDYGELESNLGYLDFTKCTYARTNSGANEYALYLTADLGEGKGITPVNDGVIRMESVLHANDSNTGWIDMYLIASYAAETDGIKLRWTEADDFEIYTMGSSSWQKENTIDGSSMQYNPLDYQGCWFVMQFEYDFSDNSFRAKINTYWSNDYQQTTGWKSGTVASPNFDENVELRAFGARVYVNTLFQAIGNSQMWIGNGDDAFPDGAVLTSNFTP